MGLGPSGRWVSSPRPAREPLPPPTFGSWAPQWAWCPFAAEGAPGVEEGCGGGRAQRQVVEGARDGAPGLVILIRVSFPPFFRGLGGACGGGGGKARGIVWERAGATAGDATGLCLCSVPPPPCLLPPPHVNKVGVVVMMEEFDEDLAPNCPELPQAAAWPRVHIPEPRTLSSLQRGRGNTRLGRSAGN